MFSTRSIRAGGAALLALAIPACLDHPEDVTGPEVAPTEAVSPACASRPTTP